MIESARRAATRGQRAACGGAALLLLAAIGCRSGLPPAPRSEIRPRAESGVSAGQEPSGACPARDAGWPLLWPPTLRPGSVIRLVAPAGELDPERIGRARVRLEQRGYRVTAGADLYAREGYLAGSDDRRARELQRAFEDPSVDAVFPGTGGYGTMRILDRLDYSKIRASGKILIGFSDITALHQAVVQCAGLVTFHSPNPMWGLGSPDGMTAFTATWFFRALEGVRGRRKPYRLVVEGEGVPRPAAWGVGRVRGRLVGGNLSLLSALEGTPYAIDTDGAILLLEDVREAPYRVDRMLRQLQLSGKLLRLRGAVLGQFTRNYDREDAPRDPDPRYTIEGVLRQYFEPLGIPVIWNFPVGHHEMNATLPLGGEVEIDADRIELRVLERDEGFFESSMRPHAARGTSIASP